MTGRGLVVAVLLALAGCGPTIPRLPLDEFEVDLLVEWVRSLE